MRVLIAIADPELADQVSVGLAAFEDIECERESGVLALERVRRQEADALILALDPSAPENQQLLEKVASERSGADVIVLGHEAAIAKLRGDKVRGRVFGLLPVPLEPVEFFRTISRLRRSRTPAPAS
jgi:hypothetical protein